MKKLFLLAAVMSCIAQPAFSADFDGIIQVSSTVTSDVIEVGKGCSLREAIIAANTNTAYKGCQQGYGNDLIKLPAGTYSLTITGAGEDDAATGDLDIKSDLTIRGIGSSPTVIDASALSDRVFHVTSGNVMLENLVIKGGSADNGGGLLFQSGTSLSILNSALINNKASNVGGAIASSAGGILTIKNSTLAFNSVKNGGGAIYNWGTVEIYSSTISQNTGCPGGGINNNGGTVKIGSTILAGNGGDCTEDSDDCSGTLIYLGGSNIVGVYSENLCKLNTDYSDLVSNDYLNTTIKGSIVLGSSLAGADQPYFIPPDKSIAINAGDTSVCVGDLAKDQIGNARGESCDIGAIEAICGDGAAHTVLGEACDDGNTSDVDACLTSCKAAKCGDGIVWAGIETCDDGNQVNDDSCSNSCKSATCGDAIVQVVNGEACDDANADNTDDCLVSCAKASCGDGFVQAGVEACDDGNKVDGDGCSSLCVVEVAADEQKDQDTDQDKDKDKVDQVVGSAVVEEETGGGGGDVNVSDGGDGGSAEPAKAGSSGGCSLIR